MQKWRGFRSRRSCCSKFIALSLASAHFRCHEKIQHNFLCTPFFFGRVSLPIIVKLFVLIIIYYWFMCLIGINHRHSQLMLIFDAIFEINVEVPTPLMFACHTGLVGIGPHPPVAERAPNHSRCQPSKSVLAHAAVSYEGLCSRCLRSCGFVGR